jgi:glycosyltransferase involved in cell wall biosynthesis
MTTPLVSVIVPAHNAMPYLLAALQSIAAQQVAPVEVLVVDGASTDRSREVALTFPQVRLIEQPGRGLAAARNLGLAAAQSDLIAFLDADDLWPTSSLRARLAHLAQHPDSLGIVGQVQRFLQPGTPLPPAYADGWLDQPVVGYTPGALLAHRRLFDLVGPFDETLTLGCDSDWFVRARDAGRPLVALAQVSLWKRIHGANLSADIARYRQELLTVTHRSLVRRGVL